MNPKQAIDVLKLWPGAKCPTLNEALKLAIKALEEQAQKPPTEKIRNEYETAEIRGVRND